MLSHLFVAIVAVLIWAYFRRAVDNFGKPKAEMSKIKELLKRCKEIDALNYETFDLGGRVSTKTLRLRFLSIWFYGPFYVEFFLWDADKFHSTKIKPSLKIQKLAIKELQEGIKKQEAFTRKELIRREKVIDDALKGE